MKKLLVVLLGLASLNVYANGCGGEYQPATGTCRIIARADRFYIMFHNQKYLSHKKK